MILQGKGNVVSQRTVQSSKDLNKKYHFIKLIDDTNEELEMITDSPVIGVKRFGEVSFSCNVIQGKYPQYRLVEIDVLDGKQ